MTPVRDKAWLEARLHESLPDEAWDAYDEAKLLEEVYEDEEAVVERIRAMRALSPEHTAWRPRPQRSSRGVAPDYLFGALAERATAVAQVSAAMAARRLDVIEFRRDVLGNRLLQPNEIQQWLAKQFVVFDDDAPTATLCYQHPLASPDSEAWIDQTMTVVFGGTLSRLQRCSFDLSQEYGWDQHEATTFVLADRCPFVEPIRGEYEFPQTRTAAKTTTRLNITVDPTVTPQELAAWYRIARKDALQPRKFQPQRTKHLRLAMFGADRPDNETWATAMQRWNAEFPDWRYDSDHVWNFARDMKLAIARLLDPPCYL